MPEDIESTAPLACPDCGAEWHAIESVKTGDDRAHEGWEDWCYCKACGIDYFYPQQLVAAS